MTMFKYHVYGKNYYNPEQYKTKRKAVFMNEYPIHVGDYIVIDDYEYYVSKVVVHKQVIHLFV